MAGIQMKDYDSMKKEKNVEELAKASSEQINMSPGAVVRYEAPMNDLKKENMIPYNHALFPAMVWPGSNVLFDVQPRFDYESLSPCLMYTYYPAECCPTWSCAAAQMTSQCNAASCEMPVDGTCTTLCSANAAQPQSQFSVANNPTLNQSIPGNTGVAFDTSGSQYFGERQVGDSYDILGHFEADGCWYPGSSYGIDKDKPVDENYNTDVVSLFKEQTNNFHNQVPDERPQVKNGSVQPYNCYHYVDLPIETLGRPRLLPSERMDRYPCVESLWQWHMNLLFSHLAYRWELKKAENHQDFSHHWHIFQDFGKVRFFCEMCKDGWTSMHGVVIFYYRISYKRQQGTVMYKICGQKCGGCDAYKFEMPLWYPEEAQKVITNLYYTIASNCFGLVTPRLNRTRRIGQPAALHNSNLCQGCNIGFCK